jgi:hypothetical protein
MQSYSNDSFPVCQKTFNSESPPHNDSLCPECCRFLALSESSQARGSCSTLWTQVAGASQEGWVMMLMRPLSPLHPILNQDEVWLVHPVCLLWQKEATSFPGGRAEADFCLGIGLKQVHDLLEKSLIRIWNGVSPVVHLSPNVFLNIQRESVAAPLPL